MPIYEYECSHCGHRFDQLRPLADRDLPLLDATACEACANRFDVQPKRVVATGTSFLLQGGGWYKDGYVSSKPTTGGDS